MGGRFGEWGGSAASPSCKTTPPKSPGLAPTTTPAGRGRQRSPGGAAPGRPRRRPRVPRGPSCCTRSRPPPPWPRPRGIQRAGGGAVRFGAAGWDQHRGPAGPERARAGRRGWGSRGPGPGRTLIPRGRGRNGRRPPRAAGVSEACWPGPSSWPGAGRGGGAGGGGSLVKRPRHCRAGGAAAVTARPWSQTRARERCGVRCSPSPACAAAPALVSRLLRLWRRRRSPP